MKIIFYFLILPGFLFIAGLFLEYLDKKIESVFLNSAGPAWHQPITDFLKLLKKGVIVPKPGPRLIFLLAPAAGTVSLAIVLIKLWKATIAAGTVFIGDLTIAVYLLIMPTLALVLSGIISKDTSVSQSSSDYMKLITACMLPFIINIFTPLIISNGVIGLPNLIYHPSAIIAFLGSIACMQAILLLAPFGSAVFGLEMRDAVHTEQSGPALALHKLNRMGSLFVISVFLIVIFCGGIDISGPAHIILGALKITGVILFVMVIKNMFSRIRVDRAIKFFYGPLTAVAAVAAFLAFLGF